MTNKRAIDGGFYTDRGLDDYNLIHQVDFGKLIERLALRHGNVVDLGCGNGYFLRDLQEKFPEINVIGVDRKKYDSPINNFVVNDLRAIDSINSRSANLVVSTAVTPWIRSEPELFYQEARRILSPQGIGIIFPLTIDERTLNEAISGKYHIRNLRIKQLGCEIVKPQLILGLNKEEFEGILKDQNLPVFSP